MKEVPYVGIHTLLHGDGQQVPAGGCSQLSRKFDRQLVACHPYTHVLRSVVILIAGWIIIGNGLAIQRKYHRSISLKSLWAMGFGETSVDEIVSWNQATEVRVDLDFTALDLITFFIASGTAWPLRQHHRRQHMAGGSFSCVYRTQFFTLLYAGSR